MRSKLSFALFGTTALAMPLQDPPEFGFVRWGRKLESALEASLATKKPVLLLFQEVPGWSTCRTFGEGPLRLPLLVEAAEELFQPVAIRNNVEGYEAEVRKRFREPAWNNPVVRFVDGAGKDLIPRQEGVWERGALIARMVASLRAAKSEVPRWLQTLERETAGGAVETALFAMTWYWEGEAQLGSLDGVLSTQAAWIGAHEVVEVRFRAQELSFERLLEHAIAHSCDQRVFATSAEQFALAKQRLPSQVERFDGALRRAKDEDQLFYLQRSPLRFVPLTPLQARRVNAALAPAAVKSKSDPLTELSPRQRELAAAIRAVLLKDKHACDGLVRPAELDQLDEYTTSLRERLNQ